MKPKYSTIPVDRIADPETPMRTDMTPESVADLVASIRQVGIIEPLVVVKKGDDYEVVAGHRRLFAAGIADVTQVPCIVHEVSGMELEMLKLHENMGRAEISAVDWATHLNYLRQTYKVSNIKIAEMLGVSVSWIDQHLAILGYPESLRTALARGELSFSSARELSAITDKRTQEVYINHAVKGGVTPTLAAQWKRQANSRPPVQEGQEVDPLPVDSSLPQYNMFPICLVCGEEVPLEHNLTIQIHDYCKPPAQS